MIESRRKFLRAGARASLFVIVPLKSVVSVFAQQATVDTPDLFRIPIESQTDPLNSLTEETLSGYLNTRFQVHTSSARAINLELIKVEGWRPNLCGEVGECRKPGVFFGAVPRSAPQRSRIRDVQNNPRSTRRLRAFHYTGKRSQKGAPLRGRV